MGDELTQADIAIRAYAMLMYNTRMLRDAGEKPSRLQVLTYGVAANEFARAFAQCLPEGMLERLIEKDLSQDILDELNAKTTEGVTIMTPKDEGQRKMVRMALILARPYVPVPASRQEPQKN